jgi:hypothetical protein
MDHWVNVAMSARRFSAAPYRQQRSRYGMGLCVLYFLMSAVAVDATLRSRWETNSKLSDERIVDSHHAQIIARSWISCVVF